MKFFKRLFKPPNQSFFLFGPRGSGKSTIVRQLFKEALWIDLLKPEILRRYSAHPEALIELIKGNPNQCLIVIDEVQKVPSLLSVVHALIEENLGLQFILTGSSSRKLRRVGADLLAGRAIKQQLHPFMAIELGKHFSLEAALLHGMIPLIVESEDPKVTLETYIGLYLQEEISTEGFVRHLESFSRFLEKISFSHGSLLNVTNIARECEIKRKTVDNFIDILEDLLLSYRLTIFTKRAQRELSAHPKFYLFDAGVFRTLRPKGIFDHPEEIDGLALEGLVAQHLISWNDYSSEKNQIHFWRTRSGLEVDFVIYGAKGLWSIEVKNSNRVSAADTKSLEAFLVDYPMANAYVLYRGNERLKIKNVLCIPVEKFLVALSPNKSISEIIESLDLIE